MPSQVRRLVGLAGMDVTGALELGRPLETDVELSADSARCRWGRYRKTQIAEPERVSATAGLTL
jgi:hypothetical protein